MEGRLLFVGVLIIDGVFLKKILHLPKEFLIAGVADNLLFVITFCFYFFGNSVCSRKFLNE